jgi:hypothetical protein
MDRRFYEAEPPQPLTPTQPAEVVPANPAPPEPAAGSENIAPQTEATPASPTTLEPQTPDIDDGEPTLPPDEPEIVSTNQTPVIPAAETNPASPIVPEPPMPLEAPQPADAAPMVETAPANPDSPSLIMTLKTKEQIDVMDIEDAEEYLDQLNVEADRLKRIRKKQSVSDTAKLSLDSREQVLRAQLQLRDNIIVTYKRIQAEIALADPNAPSLIIDLMSEDEIGGLSLKAAKKYLEKLKTEEKRLKEKGKKLSSSDTTDEGIEASLQLIEHQRQLLDNIALIETRINELPEENEGDEDEEEISGVLIASPLLRKIFDRHLPNFATETGSDLMEMVADPQTMAEFIYLTDKMTSQLRNKGEVQVGGVIASISAEMRQYLNPESEQLAHVRRITNNLDNVADKILHRRIGVKIGTFSFFRDIRNTEKAVDDYSKYAEGVLLLFEEHLKENNNQRPTTTPDHWHISADDLVEEETEEATIAAQKNEESTQSTTETDSSESVVRIGRQILGKLGIDANDLREAWAAKGHTSPDQDKLIHKAELIAKYFSHETMPDSAWNAFIDDIEQTLPNLNSISDQIHNLDMRSTINKGLPNERYLVRYILGVVKKPNVPRNTN